MMYPLMRDLSMIYRCSMRYREQQLFDTGLAGCQTPYLLALYQMPGMTQEELARHLNVNKSSVTRQLPSLEEKGYIRREADPGDKRILRVYPTQQALELKDRMKHVLQSWNTFLTQDLTENERELLAQLMTRIACRAEAYTKGDDEACKRLADILSHTSSALSGR